MDHAGNALWSKKITYTVQGYNFLACNDIVQTKDGSLLLTGTTNFSDLGDEFNLKINNIDGSIIWFKTIGKNSYYTTGNSIHLMDDDGFITGGNSGPPGNDDFLIVKYNKKGIPEWTRTIKSKVNSGVAIDNISSIIPTLDNGYIFTGTTYTQEFNYDVVMVKLNRSHNIEWSKKLSRAGWDFGASIIQNKDSSYIIAGGTNNFKNGLLLRINKTGKLLSSKISAGAGTYAYYTSLVNTRGNLFLTAGISNDRILLSKFDNQANTCNDSATADTATQKFKIDTVPVT